MKLYEIIDTQITPSSEFRPSDNILGSGIEAEVYDDSDDPHMVIKKINTTSRYSVYINSIIKNKMTGNNPYVPRVYKIDKDDKQYQIEKLYPLQQLSMKDLAYIYSTIMKEELPNGFDNKYQIIRAIESIIADSAAFKDNIVIKSKQLNDVIKLIYELTHKIGRIPDIHSGNMMARMSPYGPQLVITDPLI